MEDYFWAWTGHFNQEDKLYYVRLEKMEIGTCKPLFFLDYGRFKTHKEALDYMDSLPEPEEAARKEAEPFN